MTEGEISRIVAKHVPRGRGFDRCLEAGKAIVESLREAGVEAGLLRCRGARTEFPHAMRQWKSIPRSSWVHYLVDVPHLGITIDVTRRQFDPHAPRVVSSPRGAAVMQWDIVEGAGP